MNRKIYKYSFRKDIPFQDLQGTLSLSVLAVESLRGSAVVSMDAEYCLCPKDRVCIIDARSEIGRMISCIFTGFVEREFGEGAFKVERLNGPAKPEKKTTCLREEVRA